MKNTLIHLAGRVSQPAKALRWFRELEEVTEVEAKSLVTALGGALEPEERDASTFSRAQEVYSIAIGVYNYILVYRGAI